MQLIDLYLTLDKKVEAQQITAVAEARFDSRLELATTFQLLNEMANILRKHDNPS